MNSAEKAMSACPTGLAARTLGCHDQTLRSMARRGEIKFTRTASGRFLFDVAEYLERAGQKAA